MDFSTCSGQAGKSTCLQATTPNLPWVSAITMRLSSTRRWLAELAVPREATHLSVSSLPVALEQFTLAVRQCPNREDQALLMKVGYQLNLISLKPPSIFFFLIAWRRGLFCFFFFLFLQEGVNLSSLNFVLHGDMLVSGWQEAAG